MKNIEKFLPFITITLSFLLLFKSCGISSELNRSKKELQFLNKKMDSVTTVVNKNIKIEGLKSEKRMIQSTDRKLLDVQRQTEIDKELQILGE